MTNLEIINLLQRITGIIAFSLITLQIYLGSRKINLKLHMANGLIAYTFVLIHPLLLILYRYVFFGRFDPYYVFTDACVLCGNLNEYFINFGRIGLYLITIAVFVAKFKNIDKWLKANWTKIHPINYLAFYSLSIHALGVGTDSGSIIFILFFVFCQIVVLTSVVKFISKMLPPKIPKV